MLRPYVPYSKRASFCSARITEQTMDWINMVSAIFDYATLTAALFLL